MQLSLLPKLVEKLVWVPVTSFCTLFIPSYAFDGLLCRTLPFSPPNHVTLRITQFTFTNLRLLIKLFYNSKLLVMKANWKRKYGI